MCTSILPPIGFGTALANGKQATEAMKTAISLGYRLIDVRGLPHPDLAGF